MSDLFRRAYLAGGTLRTYSDGGIAWTAMQWSVAGNCQSPHFVEVLARRELKRERMIVSTEKSNATHRLELWVRCRQCEACRKAKAGHWRLRAQNEYRVAPRTWLVTCTFRPDVQQTALDRARHRLAKQGVDFDALPDAEKFELRHRILQREVTLFLKRLRKDGAAFRYMMVAEEHKSGAPHYHLLVHEIVGRPLVRHAMFKKQWLAGFIDAKLVADERQAVYACKYLTKSQAARVRASLGYGGAEAALAVASAAKREYQVESIETISEN